MASKGRLGQDHSVCVPFSCSVDCSMLMNVIAVLPAAEYHSTEGAQEIHVGPKVKDDAGSEDVADVVRRFIPHVRLVY